MKKVFSFFWIFFIIIHIFSFGENKNIEDGLYRVNISLWHAYEDKASMGNPGLEQQADIFVENGNIRIYIEVKPLTFANLTTSVIGFYYPDDEEKVYKPASTYVFEIEIPNEEQKRPRVFSFLLSKKSNFYNVLIDPKVEQMGNEPIKARLKIDWDTLEKIEKADIYEMAVNDKSVNPIKKEFSSKSVFVGFSGSVDASVNISEINRNALDEKGIEMNPLDSVFVYEISGVKNDAVIPFDESKKADNNIEIENLTLKFFDIKDADKVCIIEDTKLKEVAFKKKDFIEVNNAKTGTYIIVKNAEENFLNDEFEELNIKNTSRNYDVIKPQKIESIPTKSVAGKNNNETAGGKSITESNINEEKDPINFENNSHQKILKVKNVERWDIILLISFIYLMFMIAGLVLIFKYAPKLLDEFDRKMYIRHLKEDKNEK